jgi:hypothetical protein
VEWLGITRHSAPGDRGQHLPAALLQLVRFFICLLVVLLLFILVLFMRFKKVTP